jgi:hypothetical protein
VVAFAVYLGQVQFVMHYSCWLGANGAHDALVEILCFDSGGVSQLLELFEVPEASRVIPWLWVFDSPRRV